MRINWNKKNIVIAIILLIMVLAFDSWLFFKSKPTLNQVKSNNAGLTIRQTAIKGDILKKVDSQKPLSPVEKQKIFRNLMGAKVKQYHFTNEELKEILKALNK